LKSTGLRRGWQSYLSGVIAGGGVLVEGGGVSVAGDPVEGDPVLEPAEDPSGAGELRGVPAPLGLVVPCGVVWESVSLAPGMALPDGEPMLPGSVDCVPLCAPGSVPVCVLAPDPAVPALPAAPVPAPLPDVWANARVPSESVAIKRNLRIRSAFSCSRLWLSIQPVEFLSGASLGCDANRCQMLGTIPQPHSNSRVAQFSQGQPKLHNQGPQLTSIRNPATN
jgi:hypothetical protein